MSASSAWRSVSTSGAPQPNYCVLGASEAAVHVFGHLQDVRIRLSGRRPVLRLELLEARLQPEDLSL
jgi:hypothetical protein